MNKLHGFCERGNPHGWWLGVPPWKFRKAPGYWLLHMYTINCSWFFGFPETSNVWIFPDCSPVDSGHQWFPKWGSQNLVQCKDSLQIVGCSFISYPFLLGKPRRKNKKTDPCHENRAKSPKLQASQSRRPGGRMKKTVRSSWFTSKNHGVVQNVWMNLDDFPKDDEFLHGFWFRLWKFPQNASKLCHWLRGTIGFCWESQRTPTCQGTAGEVSTTNFKGDSFGQSWDDFLTETGLFSWKPRGYSWGLHIYITMVIVPPKLWYRPYKYCSGTALSSSIPHDKPLYLDVVGVTTFLWQIQCHKPSDEPSSCVVNTYPKERGMPNNKPNPDWPIGANL